MKIKDIILENNSQLPSAQELSNDTTTNSQSSVPNLSNYDYVYQLLTTRGTKQTVRSILSNESFYDLVNHGDIDTDDLVRLFDIMVDIDFISYFTIDDRYEEFTKFLGDMDDIIIQGLTRDPSSIIELKKYIDAEYFDNCISRVPVAIKYIFPTKYTKSASPIELSFMYECFRTYNEHYIEFVSTLRSIPQKAFGPSLVNFLMTYPELHPIDTAYITYRFIPPNLCNVNLLKIAIKSATNAFGDDISEDYDPVSQMGIALNTKRITSEMLTAPGVYESLHKLINIGIKKEGEEDKSSDDEYIDPRKVMAKLNKWSSDLK